MRILSALYGTELFGRERENIECYRAFQRLGHDVRVFGSYRAKFGGPTGQSLEELSLKCGELPFGSHFSLSYFRKMKGYWWLQIKRIYWCSIMMKKEASRQKADAIFLGGTMEFLYLWPFLLFQRKPIIFRPGDGPIWDSRFHKFVLRLLLKSARVVVPVSHFISEECNTLLPGCVQKTTVIWNIPPHFNKAETSSHEVRKEGLLRIVYVGQMTEKKGVKILIQALAQLQNNIQFQCRIVGGGEFSSAFEKEMHALSESLGLREVINFTGRVSDPTSHYEWANLHVAPSIYQEPFGLVIVEAKRAGIPSIVFPCGGMPELIDHGSNGWICDDLNCTSLVKAIQHCASAPLEAWGANAKKNELEVFSKDRFDNEWRAIFSDLLS